MFSGLLQPIFPSFSLDAPKHPTVVFSTCWVVHDPSSFLVCLPQSPHPMYWFLLLHFVFYSFLLTSTQYPSLCLQRSSHFIFFSLLLTYFHNQGPIGPQHSLVTHPEALHIWSFFFSLTLGYAEQPMLCALASPTICRLCFLCLVPSFNCTWYLDPFCFCFCWELRCNWFS